MVGARRRIQASEQIQTIIADDFRQRSSLWLAFGQAILIKLPAVAVEPVRTNLCHQPIGSLLGSHIESVLEGASNQFQPVEAPNGRQHMGRVGGWRGTLCALFHPPPTEPGLHPFDAPGSPVVQSVSRCLVGCPA